VDTSITFAELQQVVNIVNNFYRQAGYVTSGAFIPRAKNRLRQGAKSVVVTIRVVEGKTEAINVTGSPRLYQYVHSRLRVATSPVFNYNRVEEGLRLLQSDPLIEQISASIDPSSLPGKTLLDIFVRARQPINVQLNLNNERSPLVGTLERRVEFSNANLLGLGDAVNLTYRNTVGSNAGEASYSIPINPHNSTVQFDYAIIHSNIVEPPFNKLNIAASYRSYNITLRQPLFQQATAKAFKDFAVGLTGSRQEGNESLFGIPFAISSGADSRGHTRISALRFSQEYNQRNAREVMTVRSEFSFGIDALNATIHTKAPDSRFFLWRGDWAWLRVLNHQGLSLLLRTGLQFASRPLVPFEQFSLGGVSTVRGYRQDALLTDNGVLGTVELHIPFVSSRVSQLLLAPFVDLGYGFNVRGLNPNPNTLASAGLGIEYHVGDQVRVRLDYGIPFNAFPQRKRTAQENGFHLSVSVNF